MKIQSSLDSIMQAVSWVTKLFGYYWACMSSKRSRNPFPSWNPRLGDFWECPLWNLSPTLFSISGRIDWKDGRCSGGVFVGRGEGGKCVSGMEWFVVCQCGTRRCSVFDGRCEYRGRCGICISIYDTVVKSMGYINERVLLFCWMIMVILLLT